MICQLSLLAVVLWRMVDTYVIGGYGSNGPVITVYGLCLETQEWTIMALMDTARDGFAAALYLRICRLQ